MPIKTKYKIAEIVESDPNIVDRMWDKVARCNIEDCWLFTGALANYQYPVVGYTVKGKSVNIRCSRLSYYVHYEEEPEGLILHSCNNTRCVNPHHLRVGTQTDNMRDKVMAGRWNGLYKYKNKEKLIYYMYQQGLSQTDIANELDMLQATVSYILKRMGARRRKKNKRNSIENRREIFDYCINNKEQTLQQIADNFSISISTVKKIKKEYENSI